LASDRKKEFVVSKLNVDIQTPRNPFFVLFKQKEEA